MTNCSCFRASAGGTPPPPLLAKSWKQSFHFGNGLQNLERVEVIGKIFQSKELLGIFGGWSTLFVSEVINNSEELERSITRSIKLRRR